MQNSLSIPIVWNEEEVQVENIMCMNIRFWLMLQIKKDEERTCFWRHIEKPTLVRYLTRL